MPTPCNQSSTDHSLNVKQAVPMDDTSGTQGYEMETTNECKESNLDNRDFGDKRTCTHHTLICNSLSTLLAHAAIVTYH